MMFVSRLIEASCRYLWILATIVFALAGPAALVWFWDPLMVLLPWSMGALLATFFAIGAAIARKWAWALAAAVLPISLMAFLSNFGGVFWLAMSASEDVHFYLAHADYVRQVKQLPTDSGPRLAVFVLREDGWLGISNEHLAVYDESDEVPLPDQQRSDAWKARVKGTYLEYGVGQWRAMGDHFYIVRISF